MAYAPSGLLRAIQNSLGVAQCFLMKAFQAKLALKGPKQIALGNAQ